MKTILTVKVSWSTYRVTEADDGVFDVERVRWFRANVPVGSFGDVREAIERACALARRLRAS